MSQVNRNLTNKRNKEEVLETPENGGFRASSVFRGSGGKLQFTIALYLLELTFKKHPSLFSLDIFDLSYSFKQTARKINH